ncbi:hypothetical protein D3C77_275840 [compost metagenome]
MAKQVINLGTAPSGAGGDDRRSAWQKAISNFNELYDWITGVSDGTTLPVTLPITRGGTGGNSPAAGRAGLGLGTAATANAVGAVSQSGGLSTGAIIERGSNASGRYTKFADGTMICSATLNFSQAVTFAQDGLFIGATPTFGFPAAFIAPPQFTFSSRAQTVSTQPNAVTATTYQGLVMSMTSRTITADFIMTAQGRWYA